MLLKKFNLILVLTFFCNNLCASSASEIALETTLQKMLLAAKQPENNSAQIKRIIHNCDEPVQLFKKLNSNPDLLNGITNKDNQAALVEEYSIVKKALEEYKKEYPKETTGIQTRFDDGIFVILRPIF